MTQVVKPYFTCLLQLFLTLHLFLPTSPLMIGSFNVKTFGLSKLRNQLVMGYIEQVCVTGIVCGMKLYR
ncbi:DNASE1 [Bugula neritina]|uniref:DNASE1 n=1 Tax=Bugula neritina TaxID=10212 RepID=A0A7J7K8D9_BUGNE|nr:DNASE1 [Bugula neritina]